VSRRRLVAISLLAVVLPWCGSAAAQSPGLFAYDASAPIDVKQASAREADGVRILELTYASPKGGRVPATLLLPSATTEKVPAVVFQHGAGNASRRDFLDEGQNLARSGIASLLVDAPFNRPPFRSWLTFQLRDRAAYVQNVVDVRRAIDVLSARPEIDGERIALVGFSYGGLLAGILAGVESRFQAVVVMSGPGRITDVLRREGAAWVAAAPRSGRPARQRQLTRYLAHMRAVDAVPYVGRATAPIYFQFGRRDTMPKAWFAAYVAAAPAGKRTSWYAAGHGLCDCATRDRKAWLRERLGLAR
jgi:cephalosporin-C deacetylase-like acetyl esterase